MAATINTTQVFLQRLSLRLSDNLGDVTDNYTTDGKTIKAIQREGGINEAVTLLYEMKLKEIDPDFDKAAEFFMEKYKDFKVEVVYTRIPGDPLSNVFAKEAWIRKIFTIKVNATTPAIWDKVAHGLSDAQYHTVKTNKFSNYKPSVLQPKFFEFKDSFTLELGSTPHGADIVMEDGTLKALCLREPVYQKFDIAGADIVCPRSWEDEVLELAKSIVLGNHQQ